MVPSETASVSMCRRGAADLGSDPARTVVWVRGDHDYATREDLSTALAEAARLDDADIIVDLSGVTFLDASTIGALVDARNRLRESSRLLTVRAPSPLARRLLDVCALAFLIAEPPAAQPRVATALASWVAVPASDRAPDSTDAPVTRPVPSPTHEAAEATAQDA